MNLDLHFLYPVLNVGTMPTVYVSVIIEPWSSERCVGDVLSVTVTHREMPSSVHSMVN